MAKLETLDDCISKLKLNSREIDSPAIAKESIECVEQTIIHIHQHSESNLQLEHEKIMEVLQSLNVLLRYLLNENEDQKKEVDELKKRVAGLEKQMHDLRKPILVGQIASKFEDVLLKIILKDTSVMEAPYLTLNKVYSALKGNCDTLELTKEDKSKVEENLKKFEEKHLKITLELRRAIKTFKSSRHSLAHPEISVEKAKSVIEQEGYAEERDVKNCKSMLRVLNKLKETNLAF